MPDDVERGRTGDERRPGDPGRGSGRSGCRVGPVQQQGRVQAALIDRLGLPAHHRGDYDEAARLYQRSLDINEQFDNEADIAGNYPSARHGRRAPGGQCRGDPAVPS